MHQDLSPAELEDAYENGAYIPNGQALRESWPGRAQAFRDRVSGELNQSYGSVYGARFDYFTPRSNPKGTLLFLHGGYWRFFGPSDWSWVAEGAIAHGWNVALIGYPLAPSVPLSGITGYVRQGIETVAKKVTGPLILAGHSAGGHLVARMAMADGPAHLWSRIKEIVPISPVADLRPLLRHPMNVDLQLTAETAEAESPVCHNKAYSGPLHTWVGAQERPAFLDQARALHKAWGGGISEPAGRHHFDILDELADPNGTLALSLF